MRRFRTVAVLAIAVLSLSTTPGMATVLVGAVFESSSGKVLMNVFGNHGIPVSVIFPAIHEAEALDVIRIRLVRDRKIRDLPILIQDDSPFPGGYREPPSIQIPDERDCAATFGETGEPALYIGRCYLLDAEGASYRDLVTMTAALPELSGGVGRIEVKDPSAFAKSRAGTVKRLPVISLHFDPIWSPDGTRLLYTVWEPGGVRLEVLRVPSYDVVKLEQGDTDLYTRPVWSNDGRFIAYATLREDVKLFDTRTGVTRTFRPEEASGERLILIFFEGTVLRFTFWDAGRGYETYMYDVAAGTLQRMHTPPGARADGWMEQAQGHGLDVDRHASLRPHRSPTGRYVAIFTFVDGQRRIRVEALQ